MYLLYIKDDSKGSTTNLIFSPFDNCSKTSVYLTMYLINPKLADFVYIYPSIRKKLKIITQFKIFFINKQCCLQEGGSG